MTVRFRLLNPQIKNVNWQEIYCHSDTNKAYNNFEKEISAC